MDVPIPTHNELCICTACHSLLCQRGHSLRTIWISTLQKSSNSRGIVHPLECHVPVPQCGLHSLLQGRSNYGRNIFTLRGAPCEYHCYRRAVAVLEIIG